MAITGDRLLIILRYTFLGQKCQTGQSYTPGGAAFITANCDAVGDAWWQNVKALWRALAAGDETQITFDSVLVEEFNGSGGYGEYAIPVDERLGTRSTAGLGGILPSYLAVGMRLTVPTRDTRPGQKRFPFLWDTDVEGNVVQTTFLDLVEDLSVVYDTNIALGAPVATGILVPIVVALDPGTGLESARQDVAGHVTNGYVTSQVSRRVGHGV